MVVSHQITLCYEWQLCLKMEAAYVSETLVINYKTSCLCR